MNDKNTNLLEKIKKAKSLEWKTQDCSVGSVLFYYFPEETGERLRKFKEEISKIKFKLCIVNSKFDNLDNIHSVSKSEWFEILEESCNHFYPLKEACRIGITGTNGKTTTTDILRQLIYSKGKDVLTVGTLGVWLNNEKKNDFGLTTPNYIDLRKSLSMHSYDYLVVEASSHALVQNRFNSIEFDYGIWTSFSQDHLDYHKTIENYFEAKLTIFSKTKEKVFVFEDNNYLDKMKSEKLEIVRRQNLETKEYFNISYNRSNLLLALALLEKELITFNKDELEKLEATPGRFNLYIKNKKMVVIDFAHTPDALLNIGLELRKMYPDKKIITVMGCGGDRDKTKRPLMGKTCSEFSDHVYVTSDNPRTEDPMEIMKDIEAGIQGNNYTLILDRKEAIKNSLEQRDSIVLIAGKGHENYIDQGGVKTYYSDEEEVMKVLDDLC
jgi:UDP-N-acetylmuramoyl-L-alanyl-D-glutamate--2,6-diaminopimelate ligase